MIATFMRGDNARKIRWSDIFTTDLDDDDELSTSADDPAVSKLLGIILPSTKSTEVSPVARQLEAIT